jgi:uncharacterized protein (TIGR02246 family)
MEGMSMTRFGIACAALALLTGCEKVAPAQAPDAARTIAEVKAAIHTQVDAYAARDADKAASILAPDTIAIFHGAPNQTGRDSEAVAIKAQLADPALKLAVSDETVDAAASGDLAVYRATYRFTYTDPGTHRVTTEVGNWVAIFKRQEDGTMKLATDIVSDMPALPRAAS